MTDETLFDDHDVDRRPDPAERRAVRRHVLAGIVQALRRRHNWTVNDAASAASIAPMTWRRLEDGLDVRQRTLTALDSLLGQQFGTVRRALDDDLVMLELAQLADVDVAGVKPDGVSVYLDDLAERFRTGSPAPSSARAHARTATGHGTANLALSASAVGRAVDAARAAMPATSDLTRAAELVDLISKRSMTPALQLAVKAILAAMPDLVSVADLRVPMPTVDVLSSAEISDVLDKAGEAVRAATNAAIADGRFTVGTEDRDS